ncbi:Leu/Phe/Val dehydrogenase [Curvivirga aplysinae]|uniref:Leu/Phe/Val dehydrogenase n=1 Tax=Curvivirga aplysinae TaxID=2529852 RepID=UPI0012BD2E32|nr:Glu/Leu/Phe/Val dehydrogenase dimerization domain-containing protein [Curvivirga aplysinae]MTI09182.1 Glu/Leu/Phe/Val dehydrogenase [Curvivirga aplysinae]
MSVFTSPHFDNHENVVFCHDEASGLKAIIAIHNTNLGGALGGCRMWDYATEEEAITDALRLARGMTYKNALAGLPWGGGKSVIIGDARKDKTPEMFEAMGRFVDRLNGTYRIAEDVGTSPEDMGYIAKHTDHVLGTVERAGDPSPGTALGVFKGIQATVLERLGKNNLDNVKVAVQGLGHVGYDVARQLKEASASLCVTDIHDDSIRKAQAELGATAVNPDAIYDQDVDVYVPCALGATLNDDTISRLKAKVVAGAANNQLAEERHGNMLVEKDILYAPDYVINAGGVIYLYHQLEGSSRDTAMEHVGRIGDTLREIYAKARVTNTQPFEAADRLAEEKFMKAA